MNIQNSKAVISVPCIYCGARIGMPCVGDNSDCDERRASLAAVVKRIPPAPQCKNLGASWRRGGGATKEARICGIDRLATPGNGLNTDGVNTSPDADAPIILGRRRRRP